MHFVDTTFINFEDYVATLVQYAGDRAEIPDRAAHEMWDQMALSPLSYPPADWGKWDADEIADEFERRLWARWAKKMAHSLPGPSLGSYNYAKIVERLAELTITQSDAWRRFESTYREILQCVYLYLVVRAKKYRVVPLAELRNYLQICLGGARVYTWLEVPKNPQFVGHNTETGNESMAIQAERNPNVAIAEMKSWRHYRNQRPRRAIEIQRAAEHLRVLVELLIQEGRHRVAPNSGPVDRGSR